MKNKQPKYINVDFEIKITEHGNLYEYFQHWEKLIRESEKKKKIDDRNDKIDEIID